jgi:hypothetical protein
MGRLVEIPALHKTKVSLHQSRINRHRERRRQTQCQQTAGMPPQMLIVWTIETNANGKGGFVTCRSTLVLLDQLVATKSHDSMEIRYARSNRHHQYRLIASRTNQYALGMRRISIQCGGSDFVGQFVLLQEPGLEFDKLILGESLGRK